MLTCNGHWGTSDVRYARFTECVNSFPASGYFCRLLITFANSLDSKRRPWSESKMFDRLDINPERIIWRNKISRRQQEGRWALGHPPENDWSVDWNNLWNFGRVHQEEQFCEIILNLCQWFRRRCLKDFLSGALAVLLFGGAEPFMQFWKRALWGTLSSDKRQ